ncbi:MAG TPA: SGNH/GDSL hydrolase family protein [Thermoanaerobaculia bacterium]|jgi:lysophospholipase L1-like esterase|nr:SGNH/GDSL hydrolase family protein [Thermoanaerobaculia bacterium]
MHRVKLPASLLALALLTAGAAFGQADFSKYVAMGDSLTAGFSSGSINATFQVNSYPALLAKQFGISGFQQPLVSPPGLPGILQLARLVPTPVILPTPGAGTPTNLTLPRPYDNLAVPGATVHDLLTKTRSTSANDPTDLVLRQAGFTQLQQGLSLRPTFVTLWIGNNDALGSATAGTDQLLTPLASFESDYRTIVGAIAASGAKMALANIPDVTSIPFVTTLSRFIPDPMTGQPALIAGNFIPLIGPDGPLQPGDFVLLTATAELAVGHGIPVALGGAGVPLSNTVVLNASEAANIRARVNQYNAVISAVANERGAALVDVNTQLTELATTGVDVGGITYTSAFLKGGVFSYDGVHPTRFGYAFIANLFIDTINQKFGNNVEEVNLFPFVFGQSSASSSAQASIDQSIDQSKIGPPFIFTNEAKRSLLLSLGVPANYIDHTPAAQTPKPRRPVHNTHR